MKTKVFLVCLFLGIIYTACNDSIGRVGLGVQPDEDKVHVFETTVVVGARTIQVDSLYAKTVNGFLGELYDPAYGNIKSSYMCQYYPSIDFPFLSDIVNNKIDSVRLNISYGSYIGDSLAPMEVSVFPVTKALDGNYYTTNANPADYCDMSKPLGKYAYTARNYNITDSLLQASGYSYYISVPLPVQTGQNYLDTIRKGGLSAAGDFLKFFRGTYITTTFGTGSIIPVYMTNIMLYYTRKTTLQDVNGNDSTGYVVSAAVWSVTKEVIQLNSFENKNPAFLYNDNSDTAYLKSPAGVFTELTIPIKDIMNGVGKMKFSSIKLSLQAYPQNDWTYSLQFPGMTNSTVPVSDGSGTNGYGAKLLLIEPDSVTNFFEMKKVADNINTYTAQFNASTYSYDFNNIANVVQNAINKAPDKDLKLWVIPVLTTWIAQSDMYGNSSAADYSTSHYLFPSGVALKKGGENLKVRVIATDLAGGTN